MKIAIWHNLPSGGGKRTVYDHVRGLVERGHSVEVWCPPTADRAFCSLDSLAHERVVPLAWPPKGRLGPYVKSFYGAIEAMDDHCSRCAEEINRGGFDLLLAHPCMFLAISPIARHVKIPAV